MILLENSTSVGTADYVCIKVLYMQYTNHNNNMYHNCKVFFGLMIL